MANFINKIKVGATTYDIGMQNTIHFDGIAPISNWYTDAACKTVATAEALTASRDYLYSNKATITNTVGIGCMYIPAIETEGASAATGYELVCVELSEGISKWAILGQVKKETITGIIPTEVEDRNVLSNVTPVTEKRLTSVTPVTTEISVVSSTTANVITAAPGKAEVTGKQIISDIDSTPKTLSYVESITAGSVIPLRPTSEKPLSATVNIGAQNLDVTKGEVSISYSKATATPTEVAVNLTAGEKQTILTSFTPGSIKQAAKDDTVSVTVSDGVLNLPSSILIGLTGSANVVSSVSTGSVAVPTKAALATPVVTAVANTEATTSINVITKVAQPATSADVTLPTSIVIGIDYTAPVASNGSQTVVASVSATGKETVGVVASDATLIASVPYASKDLAVVTTSKQTIVTDVTKSEADTLVDVTPVSTTIPAIISSVSGPIVTAVL